MDLERFLNELAEEGKRDSGGAFTLDPGKAREKLKNYQQPFPYAFMGSLMAAAHLAGALMVTVEVKASGLIFAWQGPGLTADQLRDLFGALFSRAGPPFLRELALGLNGALSMRPRRLELTSGRWLHRLAPQEVVQAHDSTPGVRIELDYAWKNWPRRGLLDHLPERDFLRERCLLSVPELQLNGHIVPIPTPDGRCLVSALLEGGPVLLNSPLRKGLPPAQFHQDLPGEGPHGGIFCLYLDEPSDFRIIVDGIGFVHEVGIPGAWGYLVAPQLRRDLSAFALVEDEVYVQLLQVISQCFRSLLQFFDQAYNGLWPARQRETAPVLIHLAEEAFCADGHQLAASYYQRVANAYSTGSAYDWSYFRAAYALYLIEITQWNLGDLSDHPRAVDLAEKILVHLGIELEIQADGCLKWSGSANDKAQRLRKEMSELDAMLLGPHHPISRKHICGR